MVSAPTDLYIDPRVRRTRRQIEDAVLALAEQRDFASITVRDITELADLNRATFYLHYRDKEDACAQAVDELFSELTTEDRAYLARPVPLAIDSVPYGITSVLRRCASRPDLFRRLLADTGSMGLASRLLRFFETGFLDVWAEMGLEATPGSPPPSMRARSAAASLLGMIQWWLEDETAVTLDDATRWTWFIIKPLWFTAPPRTVPSPDMEVGGSEAYASADRHPPRMPPTGIASSSACVPTSIAGQPADRLIQESDPHAWSGNRHDRPHPLVVRRRGLVGGGDRDGDRKRLRSPAQ